MEIDDKYLFEHKLDYDKLLVKISRIRYRGEEPPEEDISRARKLGQLIGVSEEELNKLWRIRYVKLSACNIINHYGFADRFGYLVSI